MRSAQWLHDWLRRAWASPPGRAPRGTWFLGALEALYRLALPRPVEAREKGPIPVVSVGSLWVGGTGKTPLARELARMVRQAGATPAIVLRGYGGKRVGSCVRVPGTAWAEQVRLFGDEACLHAADGSVIVYVAPRRLDGVRQAASEGAAVAILDDGMQHRRLARDLEVVTLPATRPLGNRHLLPRGPLREPPQGLSRADLIVLSYAAPGGPSSETVESLASLAPRAEIVSWKAEITVHTLGHQRPADVHPGGTPVALLCGIGNPDSFRRTVEQEGFSVGSVAAYRDHHRFREREIRSLQRRLATRGITQILTTAKDAIRLEGIRLLEEPTIAVVGLEVDWLEGDKEKVRSALLRTFERSGGGYGIEGD